MSPPLPNYPPPVRPPPPEDYMTDSNQMQQRVQKRWFERNSSHIRPKNLRFPYAVTPRSNNRKSFFVNQQMNKLQQLQLWKLYGSKKRTLKP